MTRDDLRFFVRTVLAPAIVAAEVIYECLFRGRDMIVSGMARVTRDPDIRSTSGGKAVLDLGLAFDQGWGERKHPVFIDVTFFEKRAESAAQHLTKGQAVYIEGHLDMESWEDRNTGAKRSKHKIVGDNWSFAGSKRDDGNAPSARPPASRPAPRPSNVEQYGDEGDEEIPF